MLLDADLEIFLFLLCDQRTEVYEIKFVNGQICFKEDGCTLLLEMLLPTDDAFCTGQALTFPIPNVQSENKP